MIECESTCEINQSLVKRIDTDKVSVEKSRTVPANGEIMGTNKVSRKGFATKKKERSGKDQKVLTEPKHEEENGTEDENDQLIRRLQKIE